MKIRCLVLFALILVALLATACHKNMGLTQEQKAFQQQHPTYVIDWNVSSQSNPPNFIRPERAKILLDEPCITFTQDDGGIHRLKKSIALKFFKADEKFFAAMGKHILLKSSSRTNDAQARIRADVDSGDAAYGAHAFGSSHEMAQALDVQASVLPVAKPFLLAEGLGDGVCGDAPHFEPVEQYKGRTDWKACSASNDEMKGGTNK